MDNQPKRIVTRPATPGDANAVKAIELASGLSPWRKADYETNACVYGWIFLVAEADREVIGFSLARLITNQNNPMAILALSEGVEIPEPAQTEAEICNIAVAETYRREGIGSGLVLETFRMLEEFSPVSIFLEVRKSNLPAIDFYTKFGFEKERIRKNYYKNPSEDALLMRRMV